MKVKTIESMVERALERNGVVFKERVSQMNNLTTDDLWRLLNLAEDYADRFDDDAETYETYTALAAKVHNIIKETEK